MYRFLRPPLTVSKRIEANFHAELNGQSTSVHSYRLFLAEEDHVVVPTSNTEIRKLTTKITGMITIDPLI